MLSKARRKLINSSYRKLNSPISLADKRSNGNKMLKTTCPYNNSRSLSFTTKGTQYYHNATTQSVAVQFKLYFINALSIQHAASLPAGKLWFQLN